MSFLQVEELAKRVAGLDQLEALVADLGKRETLQRAVQGRHDHDTAGLQQRAERFRSALKEAGLPHVEVLPILLTRQPRVELNPFAGDCVRFGVLLGGHDHIEELSAQLGLPSDPEALYQRAADSLKTLPSEQDH